VFNDDNQLLTLNGIGERRTQYVYGALVERRKTEVLEEKLKGQSLYQTSSMEWPEFEPGTRRRGTDSDY